MYTHHQNDTCVTLFAGAAVMLKPFFRPVSDHRRAFLPAFRVTGSAGDKSGSADNNSGITWERRRQTWERRRHVWEHLESQSCIQFVFSSTYICIYIATHLHTLCLDWLQAVILRRRDRILPVTLSTSVTSVSPYNRCRSLKMYLIERVWDALGDVDRVNSEMHLEAVIEQDWTSTWRRSMDSAPGDETQFIS